MRGAWTIIRDLTSISMSSLIVVARPATNARGVCVDNHTEPDKQVHELTHCARPTNNARGVMRDGRPEPDEE